MEDAHEDGGYQRLIIEAVNLEWVTRAVNGLKFDRTREEFLTLLRGIRDRLR